MNVQLATTDEQIDECFPVMHELRPHLERNAFVEIVRDMQRDGYALAYLTDAGRIVAVAGFRTKRTLYCDRFLYVDDLVTLASQRSKGYGKALLEWLKNRAKDDGCSELRLDSGMHRKDAHRFYQANAVDIAAYHFRAELSPRVAWSNWRVR